MPTGDAVILGVWPEIDDALTDEDDAPDHPIERAALEHLLAPARRLQSAMAKLRRLAGALELLQPLVLPVLEVLDRVTANAEFDDVDRHSPLHPLFTPLCRHPIPPGLVTQPGQSHFLRKSHGRLTQA